MKSRSIVAINALLAVLIFISTDGAFAQRLHDEGRDKKAQEAAALAEEITSKASFEKQLKNLELLSKRDVDLHFTGAKRQMELDIRTFRTWQRVHNFVSIVKTTLSEPDFISNSDADKIIADLEKDCPRTEDLGKAICAAQVELKKMQKAADESKEQGKALEEELKSRLEQIGTVESLVNKAKMFLKSDSKSNGTIKELADIFINLSRTYVNYTNKLQVIRNQPKDELKLLLQRIAVETLQIEADHWKTVGEIKLRRVEEQKALASMVREFENGLGMIARIYPCIDATSSNQTLERRLLTLKGETIPITFFKLNSLPSDPSANGGQKCTVDGKERSKEELAAVLIAPLYVAASLAARGETPKKLAGLRLAQEEHRFSIRQSAVVARGYEVAISSGTKRLGRFYAGGLRPEKIAQLIYTAATVAIPAVIAGK